MKISLLRLLPVGLCLGAAAAAAPLPALASQSTVTIAQYAYTPNPITIQAGDSIVWRNSDSVAHTATQDSSGFDTGTIAAGQSSAPIQFNTAGTFLYHCTFHAQMHGSISVQGSAPPPTPTPTHAAPTPTAAASPSPVATPTPVASPSPAVSPTVSASPGATPSGSPGFGPSASPGFGPSPSVAPGQEGTLSQASGPPWWAYVLVVLALAALGVVAWRAGLLARIGIGR
ncbi:MAG: cupredoxin domain-containing protein [Candidatus Dormibacteria bacterium]